MSGDGAPGNVGASSARSVEVEHVEVEHDGAGDSSIQGSIPPGQMQVVFCNRDDYHQLVSRFRDEGFNLLSDLCAVDYLTHPGRTLPDGLTKERFEVAVVLTSTGRRQKVRVRVQVPERDPVVDSLWDLFPGTEAMEREAFDMMGIVFRGHHDLTRILMPEEWEGHPLRKDYSVGRVPVQFKEAPGPR